MQGALVSGSYEEHLFQYKIKIESLFLNDQQFTFCGKYAVEISKLIMQTLYVLLPPQHFKTSLT